MRILSISDEIDAQLARLNEIALEQPNDEMLDLLEALEDNIDVFRSGS